MHKVIITLSAIALTCGTALAAAHAQDAYPTRPITMVVPLPAGGTADLLCRLAAQKAGDVLGQRVIVDNRPGGAGARVGTEHVQRSAPDGYTLLCAPQLTLTIADLLFGQMGYDTRNLEPVSVLAAYPLIVLGRAGVPFDDLPGMIAYAKAHPGKLNYGHQGKGNTGHLLGENLMLRGKFKMTEIPYRGSAPAIQDMLAGRIDILPDYLLVNKPHIAAGKMKLLAVGSHERLKEYPKVATIAETLPGLYADTWMAVAAPPGTPKAITEKFSAAIAKGFQDPALRKRILALEAEPLATTPEKMREIEKESRDTWGAVVKAAHISIH
jgi:tripartite-type tricarboxylate transporter receptor subunit TctC